ncbi:MAG: hypothetical protein IJ415_03355 [Clostridia bacterium]|nr:hypothetical protein [Clostridia bacterium]
MKKDISHQKQLKFNKKHINKNSQKSLKTSENKLFKIGIFSIKIFFVIGIVGIFFTPWIAFAMIPGFVIPLIIIAISNLKKKKTIDSLTQNIKRENSLEMDETGEWTKIAHDIHFNQTNDLNNNEQTRSKINIENQDNNDLSL